MSRFLSVIVLVSLSCVIAGCMPAPKAPVVNGPIDGSTATQLQMSIRSDMGDRFSVTHQVGEKEFAANWEISNAFKRNAQLQIKPPADWTYEQVRGALEVVLADHTTKPWYGQIDETVLRLADEAQQDGKRAVGQTPETPYEVAVKVNQHTSEWFLEVKVQILDEDGSAFGI